MSICGTDTPWANVTKGIGQYVTLQISDDLQYFRLFFDADWEYGMENQGILLVQMIPSKDIRQKHQASSTLSG